MCEKRVDPGRVGRLESRSVIVEAAGSSYLEVLMKKRSVVPSDLSVGAMAERAGVSVSTLHYYEAEGLIRSWRTEANHRRYDRAELRRLALIRIAQSVGLSLSEIREAMRSLPRDRAFTAADWRRVSARWTDGVNRRIASLEKMRDNLEGCIGCGCLSMENCPLYNRDDALAVEGPGARRW